MRSLALAVDFGGTKVDAALVDDGGAVLPDSRFRATTGPSKSSAELRSAVQSVVTRALGARSAPQRLIGIGIGSAGPIGLDRGLVSPVNLPVWREFPLRATVEDAAREAGFASPAVLRLDGLCITVAEACYGAARGYASVLGMVVSTGVGGGLITDGQLVSGRSGNAGHIGQIEVPGFTGPGEDCTLEAIASGPRTVAWANDQGWAGTTGHDVARAHAEGHPIARRAVQRSAAAVGRAIASVTTLLDLDCVVIGGGFAQVTVDYIDQVRDAARNYASLGYAADVQLHPAGLGSDGPLVGAAALVHGGPVDAARAESALARPAATV